MNRHYNSHATINNDAVYDEEGSHERIRTDSWHHDAWTVTCLPVKINVYCNEVYVVYNVKDKNEFNRFQCNHPYSIP